MKRTTFITGCLCALGLVFAGCGGASTGGTQTTGEQTTGLQNQAPEATQRSSVVQPDFSAKLVVAKDLKINDDIQVRTVNQAIEETLPLHFAHSLEVLGLPPPMLQPEAVEQAPAQE